jgi:hypothetical protein
MCGCKTSLAEAWKCIPECGDQESLDDRYDAGPGLEHMRDSSVTDDKQDAVVEETRTICVAFLIDLV